MPPKAPNLAKRSRVLATLVFVLGAIIIARLFYVQVIMHSYYEAAALKEHIGKFTIAAKRGEIYARDGQDKIASLVLNEPSYTVYADARYIKDVDKTVNTLRKIAGGNVVNGFDQDVKDNTRQYVVLAKQLNQDQANLLKKENLPGVGLQQGESRVYPEGSLAAQVLGFVNGDGQGQYGIEEGMAGELAGMPGQLKAVTDVNGIPISVGQDSVQTPAVNGTDVVLSIDRNIQSYAEQALKAGLDRVHATHGSALVLNPNNGQVMAMANYPTYDPAKYQATTDYSAFQNTTVSGSYEPGSVIKTLSMSTGLNEGVVQPDTTYNNTGTTPVADAVIKNAVINEDLGTRSMKEVIKYSLNTGMVYVLRQLGGGDINDAAKQKLYQYYTDRFFLGRATGITLAGEQAGSIVPPNDAQGGPVRYANMTFGQGMTATMVQVCSAFSAAINGGVYYAPQIIYGRRADSGNVTPVSTNVRKSDVVTADTSSKLRSILEWSRSTSDQGKRDKQGYGIGGKSGTAQVYDSKTGTYSQTDTIGSYIGYGGATKPEYVIMVRVDDAHIGDFAGSGAAAPIFADISNWLLDYLKIQPRG